MSARFYILTVVPAPFGGNPYVAGVGSGGAFGHPGGGFDLYIMMLSLNTQACHEEARSEERNDE
jgi:hypothetical protein